MIEQGRAELDIRYGSTARQYIDLYKGEGDGPLAMFIHGGYWRALSPKEHSHFARGLTERGVNVAVAGYDLTPQVSIAQIIDQMRAAALFLWKRFGKRITVYGHSAGGHLTACMIATDWKALDPAAPSDLVAVGSAISGVFDLTRLVHTDMNADFKLDEKSAHDEFAAILAGAERPRDGRHRRRRRIAGIRAAVEGHGGDLGQGRRRDPLRGGAGQAPFQRGGRLHRSAYSAMTERLIRAVPAQRRASCALTDQNQYRHA